MPASHLGPGPTHAINRRRPGSRETQSEVVSPEPGSRGTRAWGDEALPCGPHAVLSVNQTTSSWILYLYTQTTKHRNLYLQSLATGSLHAGCDAGSQEKATKRALRARCALLCCEPKPSSSSQ